MSRLILLFGFLLLILFCGFYILPFIFIWLAAVVVLGAGGILLGTGMHVLWKRVRRA